MLASLASPQKTVWQKLASLASPRKTVWGMLASLASLAYFQKGHLGKCEYLPEMDIFFVQYLQSLNLRMSCYCLKNGFTLLQKYVNFAKTNK
jgi:hypothetical protein